MAKEKFDLNKMITDRFINGLEKGLIPWKKSWNAKGAGAGYNYASKKEYRGVNSMITSLETDTQGYELNAWLTFNQCTELGGTILKGSKSIPVVYWLIKDKDKEGNPLPKEKKRFCPMYSNVFNVAQTTLTIKTKDPVILNDNQKIEACENVYLEMRNKPSLSHGGGRAYYQPRTDAVQMPELKYFDNSANYYATLFHELVHATGHASRLNRDDITEHNFFGSESYSREELVAEIGSNFLTHRCQIESDSMIENSQAYINGWISKLKSDPKLIISASQRASKAVDYIVNTESSEAA